MARTRLRASRLWWQKDHDLHTIQKDYGDAIVRTAFHTHRLRWGLDDTGTDHDDEGWTIQVKTMTTRTGRYRYRPWRRGLDDTGIDHDDEDWTIQIQTHTPSIAFLHLPPNCQIWLRHWRGTLYLRAAVHRRGQRPPKGLTVEAT